MINSWETLTGTRSTIESDRTIATVTFPLKSAIQRKTEDNDVPVNVPVNLTETQQQVLSLIKENHNITHREIAEQLSITDKTAKRTTMALRQLGMIAREGSDKTGYWKSVRD